MKRKKECVLSVSIILPIFFFGFCSLKKMAMNTVADTLAAPEGGTVFTGDNDPELVGEAIPFAIKMYESIMASIPQHRQLRLRTGSIYIMYANAFLQTPANLLGEDEYKKQEFLMKRAKNLYLRGRDILLEALEQKFPGFIENLNKKRYDLALASVTKEDVPFLYWSAAGWLGAFAIDPFDMKLGLTVPRAAAMMDRALLLDERFRQGAIHEFYVLYYGSMPDYMGGDFKKARYHFKKAVEQSGGKSSSAYLALATGVVVKEQKLDEFKMLLEKVLSIDPEEDADNRLVTILNQRQARWLLDHIDDYFLLETGNEEDEL
jgi:predicted anti-sigma-YlaC factor YlaD